MIGALWTGISGLGGSQDGLDNESNNIANVNTIGYKSSRISFADQMYQDKIGKGVTSFDVEKMYTQGNLKNTGVSYDMALSDDGFFQVSNGKETYYTRAGNFRMGESGMLEDVAKDKVQGWAVSPVTDDSRIATDPNATKFTNSYSKLLGNKIIRDTTSIDTVIAKATDYTTTAVSDSKPVFSGAGYKSASTKIADVEALITEYNKLLTTQANANPKPTASSSHIQKNYMNFNLNNVALDEGDEMYAYIDGKKYSQSFDTDEETTIKEFADVLSNTPGFKAYYTDGIEDNATGTVKESAYEYDNAKPNPKGGIYLEGLIPGKSFKITEFGWTDASNNNLATKGEVKTIQDAVLGSGMGGIKSVEEALAQAVSGKQEDVYSPTELMLSSASSANNFTYQMNIYDKDTKTNKTIPQTALSMTSMADVDTMVTAINTVADATTHKAINTELAYYVKAYNINGNLVVKTLDKNNDVEFTGALKGPIPEQQTVKITGQATSAVSFLGESISNSNAPDSVSTTVEKLIADKSSIISTWNSNNSSAELSDIVKISTDEVKLIYKNTEGDVADIAADTSNGITFDKSEEIVKGALKGLIGRNIDYSGREGTGAEFLKITTSISQTASKGDLQLRLDSLDITDSAFGDFSVDDTGLVTMKQDGTQYAIGQIAVAKFTDNRGLNPVGDNLYESTNRSGTALFNINNDKTAAIKGGTLELSTADLSESLVNLMVFQRAFEANSKSITTADSILNTLIQLKR